MDEPQQPGKWLAQLRLHCYPTGSDDLRPGLHADGHYHPHGSGGAPAYMHIHRNHGMPGTGFYELCDRSTAIGGEPYLLAGDEWSGFDGSGQ